MSRPAGVTRFYLGYVLMVMLITGIVGVQISQRVQDASLRDFEGTLRDQAIMLRELSTPVLREDHDAELLQSRIEVLGTLTGIRLTVLRADGVVLADSRHEPQIMDNHGEREEIRLARRSGMGQSTRRSFTLGLDMTYFALEVVESGQSMGFVRTALPLTEVESHLEGVRRVILLGAVVLGGLSLLLGVYLLRGAMRPLSLRTEAAEIEAAEDRRRLVGILTSMTEGVVAVDAEQRVVHANAAAGRLFGISPTDAVGAPAWKILRRSEVLDCLEEVIRTRHEQELEFELKALDRINPVRLELRAAPLRGDGSEDPVGVVLVFHDVTRLRHLESVRQDFVANVSHEIKTPLAAAQGMVETMIDDPSMDESTQARFLERVHKQMRRLGNLVNDLLALSRYEGDDLPLANDEVDLRLPLLDAVEQIQPYAQSKSLSLDADVPTDAILVEGDAEALQQVFDNLLSNAVRYTPEAGRVHVRLSIEGTNAVAEVQDSGIGIESAHLGRIFERFYRVDRARSRELGGTGLGLSIVKHILVRMNGGISVQSQVGEGSSFRIHLPLLEETFAPPGEAALPNPGEQSDEQPLT